MREIEDWELRVGRADPDGYDAFMERLEECRGVLAAMLSADPDGIALTHSTTEALNHAVFGLDWRPGRPDRDDRRGAPWPELDRSGRWPGGPGVEVDVVEAGDGRRRGTDRRRRPGVDEAPDADDRPLSCPLDDRRRAARRGDRRSRRASRRLVRRRRRPVGRRRSRVDAGRVSARTSSASRARSG